MGLISTQNEAVIRMIADDPNFTSVQALKGEANGHLFKEGDEAILHGLEHFPEFNGQKVKISAIRQDDEYGRAYYIEREINHLINWVYEYRLKPVS